jgi:ABC-type Zn2+ transport system substrate-binding protein/surface adhesin
MEARMKQELTAELTGESIEKLDELVKKLDGKSKVIGAGKIHFRYNFKQFIIKVNSRAFKALKDAYEYFKDKYECLTGQLKIDSY